MDVLDMTIQPRQKRGKRAWFAAAAATVVLLAGVGYDTDQNEEQEQPAVGTTQSGFTQAEFEALRKQMEFEKRYADEVLDKLNATVNERNKIQSELNVLREQMEFEKRRADEALDKLNATVNERNEIKRELEILREQARLDRTRAAEAFEKCRAAEKKLDEQNKLIRENEALLEKAQQILAMATQEKESATERLLQREKDLSRTSGQLETTKHELELLREQARLDRARADEALEKCNAAEKKLDETKSNLNSTQAQLNGMVRVLTDVNNELAKIKTESNQYRSSLAATEEKLNASERLIEEKDKQIAEKQQDLAETRKEANELKRQLINDVLSSYNASTLELSFHLVNDRFLSNITIDKSFFLPTVSFNGKNWIVSAFRDATGLTLYSNYSKVIELQYKVRRPQNGDVWTPISGPALCLAEDSRVCLFPVSEKNSNPMHYLSFEELRERGLDNLTLFKSGTFSKASADITGRCSLSLQADDNNLYIRNSNRSSSELKAEVGDFVLSKEGAFVGVVVKVGSTDFGQASTAQCFIFPGEPELTKAFPLDLTKAPSQSSFVDFVEQHERLRKLAEQLDKGE